MSSDRVQRRDLSVYHLGLRPSKERCQDAGTVGSSLLAARPLSVGCNLASLGSCLFSKTGVSRFPVDSVSTPVISLQISSSLKSAHEFLAPHDLASLHTFSGSLV